MMEIELTRLERPKFIPVCGDSAHGSSELVGWYNVRAAAGTANILEEFEFEDLAKVDMTRHQEMEVPCAVVVYTDEDGYKSLAVRYLLINHSNKYKYTLELSVGYGSARLDNLVMEQLTRMGDLWTDALN
jgi:hypothetical protein